MGRGATERNPKVRATVAIWSLATGMLGICIPLVAITNSGIILPLLVILGAAGSTAAVWLASERHRQVDFRSAQAVNALEERVIALETICTSLSPADDLRILQNASTERTESANLSDQRNLS
ncbi:MAG: hypothetical protein ABG776_14335 [Cyanobacteria bacterium J06555_13]